MTSPNNFPVDPNVGELYTAAEVAELLKSDNGWHGPAFCVPIAEVSALKAQCAAILEKVTNRVESIGTDASEGYKLACEDAAMIVRALIPTDHAAALAEHDSDVRYIQALEIMKVFGENNVVAVWSNGARQPFHEVVKNALAERERLARLEEAEWWHKAEMGKHRCTPVRDGILYLGCERLAALRAEGAKQP